MKTIKNILVVAFVLFYTSLEAQEKKSSVPLNNTHNIDGGGTSSGPPPPALPNITPASPEAFAITKYGDIKVNEFNGMISETLPLHTFKAGKIEVPITMNYSGAGLKVDDFPTKTGMVWTLRAGGVITRLIKDKPDEEAGTGLRVFKTAAEFVALNQEDGTSGATYLSSLVAPSNGYDTEADIYSYDFNGYSGSFFLDQNLNPVLINENSPLKVERYGNLNIDKKFIITTPDGTQYFFGGEDAIETTFKIHNVNDEPVGDTSYHLTKIVYPNNSQVDFEYLTIPRYQTFLSKHESITYLTDHDYHGSHWVPDYEGGYILIPCLPPGFGSAPPQTFSNQTLTVRNVRYIKKISSSDTNEVVYFNYQDLNYFKVLDNIEIKSLNAGAESLKKSIQFNYLNLADFSTNTQRKRFFLESIKMDNQVAGNSVYSNKTDTWKFQYDNYSGMPQRGSYAQDDDGFYNGKNTNTTLLSSHVVPQPTGINYEFVGADKTPDFNFAKLGSLKKIIFPTGGYTTFDYECIPYRKPFKTSYFMHISSGYSEDQPDEPIIPYSSIPGNNGFGGDPIVFPTIIEDQDVVFKGRFSRSELHSGGRTYTIKITNLTDNSIVYNETRHYAFYNPFTFTLHLYKNKQYKFELIDLDPESSGPLSEGVLTFDVITHYEYGDGNGLRIKRQVDYSQNNQVGNYRRYYYMPTNYIYLPIHEQPINSINRFLKFKNTLLYRNGCPVNRWVGLFSTYQVLVSDPLSSTFMNFSRKNRCVVTSYGGENFENGGVERFYHIEDDYDYGNQELEQMSIVNVANGNFSNQIAKDDFLDKTSNINTLDGTLEKEYYFTKETSSFYKIKQVDYNYTHDSLDGYVNFVGKSFYDPIYFPTGTTVATTTSNHYLKMYKTFTFRNYLESKNEIAYFDKIQMPIIQYNTDDGLAYSITEANDAGVKKVAQVINYTYGPLKGLPTEVTTTSSDGSILKTKNTYVNDFNSLLGLSTLQQGAYAGLISQNIVANPIEVKQYKGDNLLSTQRTLYKDWNNMGMVLPEFIQTAKGNASLEDRAKFEEYDSKGNPTLVSYVGGMKTKYVYNSLNQVIAKLDNFTGSLDPNTNSIADACSFIGQYPLAQVTVYTYDPITNLLMETMDSNCQKTTYVYDALHHLKQIKDHQGNVIKEFDSQYKPQN